MTFWCGSESADDHKKSKRSHKLEGIKVFLIIFADDRRIHTSLTNGSGPRRLKNIRIRIRIRFRNTALNPSLECRDCVPERRCRISGCRERVRPGRTDQEGARCCCCCCSCWWSCCCWSLLLWWLAAPPALRAKRSKCCRPDSEPKVSQFNQVRYSFLLISNMFRDLCLLHWVRGQCYKKNLLHCAPSLSPKPS